MELNRQAILIATLREEAAIERLQLAFNEAILARQHRMETQGSIMVAEMMRGTSPQEMDFISRGSGGLVPWGLNNIIPQQTRGTRLFDDNLNSFLDSDFNFEYPGPFGVLQSQFPPFQPQWAPAWATSPLAQRRYQLPSRQWRARVVESPSDPAIEFVSDGSSATWPWNSTPFVIPRLDLTLRITRDMKYNARIAWNDFCAAFYLPPRIPATQIRLIHRVLRILRWVVNRKVRVITKYRREKEKRFEELA